MIVKHRPRKVTPPTPKVEEKPVVKEVIPELEAEPKYKIVPTETVEEELEDENEVEEL